MEHLLNTIQHSDALELLAQLPDGSIDLLLTDFPYNTTQAFWETELDFEVLGRECFRVIKPKGAVISTAAQPFTSKLVMAWLDKFQYEWIWRKTRKTNFLNAKIMPLSAHESILVFGHKKPNYYPQMIQSDVRKTRFPRNGTILYGSFDSRVVLRDEYYPNTVIEFKHDDAISASEENHPNQKPLELWEYLIKTYSQANDIILDPFCGSGTSAHAAFKLGRNYICGDLHLPYVEMARKRLANADPYKDKLLPDGTKQLSLFSEEGN